MLSPKHYLDIENVHLGIGRSGYYDTLMLVLRFRPLSGVMDDGTWVQYFLKIQASMYYTWNKKFMLHRVV